MTRPEPILRALMRHLAPQRASVVALALLLIVGTGMQLAVPQVLRRFIDTATGGMEGSLPLLALAFLALALTTQLLGAGAAVLGTLVGQGATNALRRDLLAHVLSLDLDAHARRRPGEWIERIDADATALADFFAQFTGRVVAGLLLTVGVLVVLAREQPLLGLVFTAFVALEVAVLLALRSWPVPATAAEREASAQLFGFLEERTRSLGDLRANGAAAHTMRRFAPVMATFRSALQRAVMMRSTVWLIGLALFGTAVVATLALGVRLVGDGAITVGTAYMVFQYLLLLQGPIEQVTQQLQVLQRAGASLGRIDALLAERSALRSGDAALPEGPLSIAFEGVSFRYPDAGEGAATLRGIDLKIPSGAQVGLIGRTGSGKTTLTRLLYRFFDPSEGRLLLGGVDARTVPIATLRRRVGFLTQEVGLIAGSVRDNLTFFDDSIPDAALHAALREVGLSDWLARFPEGLDARIGSQGATLSAGEGQLLALARLMSTDPGVVILDEPTSRLDPDTEARLEQALGRLLAGRTAVVIAHRLATVERADFVCLLRDGTVAEFGARSTLAADPDSGYAALLAAAAVGAAPEELS
jgi:ABC-type multidrug transport system fused ATPase/permease subunit